MANLVIVDGATNVKNMKCGAGDGSSGSPFEYSMIVDTISAGNFPTALGQALMAASLPVVLPSDQVVATEAGKAVVTALNSVTTDTTSSITTLSAVRKDVSMQVVLTGSPTGGTITLQGSLDGTTFDPVTGGLALFTIGTDTSGNIKFSAAKPFLAYRVVLAGLTGGTTPHVTAKVAVA